ncbi:hypothetical protein KGA66_12710 [Actinocrinis puniceicyclus]|uniref:Uncharacterized protein n=1 Tax=Actinocrinis puniceicyclus TaxID=977794 RepID=A0A8J7WKE1_9ACTN|nr:hypothetical protein [Actinocrinis puniceicyclus]MBS2963911.1 hypothetical protein [Actinocrinis puniceicyclus]
MSATYERTSVASLNGASPDGLNSENTAPDGQWREDANGVEAAARYTPEELALRTGVPRAVLCDLRDLHPLPGAAIDVVRLAVVGRLLRSGVPVARAAALVRAAESRTDEPI